MLAPMGVLVQLLEAANILKVVAPHGVAALLSPFAGFLSTRSNDVTCIARHLGDASTLNGQHEEGKAFYHQAIHVCTQTRHRPELALTRLGLAELLLDHYPDEHAEAIEHLDFAIGEFREMKMQPSLERALGRKQVLGA